jgi:hypothetical protein
VAENGYRKPQLMRELDVEIWLNDPQDPLEHQISALFEEYWRAYAAIKRCSYAYPFKLAFAVRPRLKIAYDADGKPRPGTFEDWVQALHERIDKKRLITKAELDNEEPEKDDNGNFVPLRNVDLCVILGWNPRKLHQNIVRAIEICRYKGLVKPGFPFYLDPRPSLVPPDEKGLSTETILDQLTLLGNVFGLEVRISTETSPEAVQRVKQICTDALAELSTVRKKWRTKIREAGTEPGIIIESARSNKTYKNGHKRGKEGEEAPPAAAAPQSPPPPPPPAAPPPAASAAPASAQAKTNGHDNGNGTRSTTAAPPVAPTALAAPDPEAREKNACYDELRGTFEQAGRPVSMEQNRVAYARFSAFSLSLCLRIIADARQRLNASWIPERNKRFNPTLPEYLDKREWENPVTAGASPPGRAEQRDAETMALFHAKVMRDAET